MTGTDDRQTDGLSSSAPTLQITDSLLPQPSLVQPSPPFACLPSQQQSDTLGARRRALGCGPFSLPSSANAIPDSPRRANDSRLSLTGSSNGNGDTGGKKGRRGVEVRGWWGGGVCVQGGVTEVLESKLGEGW